MWLWLRRLTWPMNLELVFTAATDDNDDSNTDTVLALRKQIEFFYKFVRTMSSRLGRNNYELKAKKRSELKTIGCIRTRCNVLQANNRMDSCGSMLTASMKWRVPLVGPALCVTHAHTIEMLAHRAHIEYIHSAKRTDRKFTMTMLSLAFAGRASAMHTFTDTSIRQTAIARAHSQFMCSIRLIRALQSRNTIAFRFNYNRLSFRSSNRSVANCLGSHRAQLCSLLIDCRTDDVSTAAANGWRALLAINASQAK